MRFVNPWQDTKRGVWAALAYIDRREAAQIYDSRITANMAAINALASDAGRKNEILYAASLLYRAKRDGLSFAVTVRSPENSGRLERKLNALLEDSGYVTTSGNALYTISARLTGEETTSSEGNFVTPGIIVRIERDGKMLFSTAKRTTVPV